MGLSGKVALVAAQAIAGFIETSGNKVSVADGAVVNAVLMTLAVVALRVTQYRVPANPQAGLTALAFDRFDHRGFFAADISAGAAAQMQFGMRR